MHPLCCGCTTILLVLQSLQCGFNQQPKSTVKSIWTRIETEKEKKIKTTKKNSKCTNGKKPEKVTHMCTRTSNKIKHDKNKGMKNQLQLKKQKQKQKQRRSMRDRHSYHLTKIMKMNEQTLCVWKTTIKKERANTDYNHFSCVKNVRIDICVSKLAYILRLRTIYRRDYCSCDRSLAGC